MTYSPVFTASAFFTQPELTQPTAARLTFPKLVAKNLLGELTTVPERRSADGYLVLATLAPWDDQAAQSWVNPARSLFSRLPGIRGFWLPVFPSGNLLTRWLVRRKLRKVVRDPVLRRIMVPVFGQAEMLRRQLDLPADQSVFGFAVGADGLVHGVVAGAWSWDNEAKIATAIRHAPLRVR